MSTLLLLLFVDVRIETTVFYDFIAITTIS